MVKNHGTFLVSDGLMALHGTFKNSTIDVQNMVVLVLMCILYYILHEFLQ